MHDKIEPQVDFSEDERGLMVHRYSMFHPVSPKQLFYDYPELRKYDELRSMRPEDVVFCWYMAHPSSPVVHWTKEDSKAMLAAKRSYIGKMSQEKYNRLIGLKFPEEFKIAMELMASFKPGTRARLLEVLEATLSNWESVAKIKIDLVKLAKGDNMKEVKEYILSTEKIMNQMPKLLEQAEQRFSLRLNEDADGESEYIGLLDAYHNENAKSKSI